MKNGESPVSHDRTLLNHGWSSWGLRGPHPSQAATYAENCQGISRLVSEAVSSYQNICCNRVTDSPLSSLSLLSSVAVGGFEEMAGDQMKLRSGWPQIFFAMPELVSVIAEHRVVFFQYFSLTLELCPQLTKWYAYYFCNLSTFKLLDWLPDGCLQPRGCKRLTTEGGWCPCKVQTSDCAVVQFQLFIGRLSGLGISKKIMVSK